LAELPSGTVTFLFTDIEGSTRLWEEYPEAMRDALARHDETVRDAIESHGGYVVKTTGDGFHAAFATAQEGLATAVAAQVALSGQDWGGVGSLRVRMGVHTGAATLRDGDYFGTALNRAARLMAVAHGGQVVCSQATADLAREALAEGVALVDLGEHRLRDLAEPVRVFELVHPTLPTGFPPLRSLDAFPGNLPIERTTLVGRTRERAKVAELLAQRHLVTLTGVGGVGKTRLALHVAAENLDRFPDGVWLVPLATIREPALVPSAVAGALGVPEQASRDPIAVLIDAIGTRTLLLVIDNCEHLLEASARLADALLDSCPNLCILATSREGLGVEGEQSWPTPSLGFPDAENASFDDVTRAHAVELFVERARAARPDFVLSAENAQDVAALCARLDGIPLAIELAAARVSALTPRDILDRIDQRFRLLTGGSRTALERHQTLQAAVAWSYDLLHPRERRLFDRLSVFAGGFTLVAAHAIAADDEVDEIDVLDQLASLVSKSMILADGHGASARFGLLETLRQYGRDRLAETPDVQSLRDRHGRWFLAQCELLEPGPNDLANHNFLEAEIDNIRAAFDWFAERGDASTALRCIRIAFMIFLESAEGLRRSERLLQLTSDLPPAERADLLATTAFLAVSSGDYPHAAELADASIRCARDAGTPAPGWAHSALGIVAFWHNEPELAVSEVSRGVDARREADDGSPRQRQALIGALDNLCFVLAQTGDGAGAIAAGEEALDIAQQLHSPIMLRLAQWQLALACQSSDRVRAAQLLEECLRLDFERRSTSREWELLAYAQVLIAIGDYNGALSTLADALTMARQLGDRSLVPPALLAMARALRRLDRPDRAARIRGASEGQRAASGIPGGPADAKARARIEQQLRETLNDARFHAAFEAGSALSRDEAFALALGAARPSDPTTADPPGTNTGN
jgi:predicted ATPase/class 3 adenylate cyclase